MNEELLYNQIYEKTKDCGRTQFVRLLMDKERENKELKEQLQQKGNIINKILDYIDSNKFVEQFKNVGNERNVRNKILEILDNKGE